jgi:EthD domain
MARAKMATMSGTSARWKDDIWTAESLTYVFDVHEIDAGDYDAGDATFDAKTSFHFSPCHILRIRKYDGKAHVIAMEGKGMIKRITLLTRKPGMSREEFVRHWTEKHGRLLADHPSIWRLVANPVVEFKRFGVRNPDPARPAQNVQPEFEPDGFWELWFKDRDAMEEMYNSPFAKKLVAEAEHFVGSLWTFVVEEEVVIDKTSLPTKT